MLPNPFLDSVQYHIYKGGELPPLAQSYDYILGGNGLFIRAHNRFVEICYPLAPLKVNLLPDVTPYLRLPYGMIDGRLLMTVMRGAAYYAKDNLEVLYLIHLDEAAGTWRLVKPDQKQSSTTVQAADASHIPNVVCEIHSHHKMPAFWSDTDDHDEQEFRFYGVVGNFNPAEKKQPEILLRLAVAGYHLDVPVFALFTHGGMFIDKLQALKNVVKQRQNYGVSAFSGDKKSRYINTREPSSKQ